MCALFLFVFLLLLFLSVFKEDLGVGWVGGGGDLISHNCEQSFNT